jgi:tRNA pseudouridine55 synthase
MINGILNVYKEAGWTSNDVVSKLKGIAGQRKIGHTGTLDPDAEGVLPVCLGKATKLCEYLTDERKTYEAVLLLGVTTDTQDASGVVLRRAEGGKLPDERAIREVITGFLGRQMQIPPMYSARKIGGQRLYDLARQGVTVERDARPVYFYEIAIQSVDLPRVRFSVTCSRGTYIRTLCNDIGDRLGCGGCMEYLLRTQVGPFRLEDARKIGQLQELRDCGHLMEAVVPIDRMYAELPAFRTDPQHDTAAHNGNEIASGVLTPQCGNLGGDGAAEEGGWQNRADAADAGWSDRIRLYDSENRFVGVFAAISGTGRFRPEQMYYDPEPAGL